MSIDVCQCTDRKKTLGYPVWPLAVIVFVCDDCNKIGIVKFDPDNYRVGVVMDDPQSSSSSSTNPKS